MTFSLNYFLCNLLWNYSPFKTNKTKKFVKIKKKNLYDLLAKIKNHNRIERKKNCKL